MTGRKKFYADLAERVGWTFVQGFAAEWIVTAGLDANTLRVGAVAGGIAVAKVVIGTRIGASNSGAWLPADTDPPGPERV